MASEKITSFTQLLAWQRSHELVLATLKICDTWQKYDFLKNQLERAVLSITSNIAEGFGRQSKQDKKHFYVIARGSAHEAQNQLLVARDIKRLTNDDFKKLANLSSESVKLLQGLIRSLER